MQPTDPQATPPSTSPQANIEFGEGRGSGASGRVLVIATDAAVRQTLAILATADGCDVLALPHGEPALQAVRTWGPAVILFDVQEPDADAPSFVRPYREAAEGRSALIVLTNSPIAPEMVAQMEAVGALPKPFDVGELLDLLDRYAECH